MWTDMYRYVSAGVAKQPVTGDKRGALACVTPAETRAPRYTPRRTWISAVFAVHGPDS